MWKGINELLSILLLWGFWYLGSLMLMIILKIKFLIENSYLHSLPPHKTSIVSISYKCNKNILHYFRFFFTTTPPFVYKYSKRVFFLSYGFWKLYSKVLLVFATTVEGWKPTRPIIASLPAYMQNVLLEALTI